MVSTAHLDRRIAGSIKLAWLELDSPSGGAPSEAARNIILGIGASFVASGFIAWGLLQAKEMTMYIADWFRAAAERRQQRRSEEAYLRGYEDAQQGKPPRPSGFRRGGDQEPPEAETTNGTDGTNVGDS
ncbi:MAG: hypothetical protein F4X66_00240 [Chloroflexi bacterium]|nr:hypothetical protein [Chloroflexota bacterium]MYE42100.1 hypothetical protein [Chloroflexota bacterium]